MSAPIVKTRMFDYTRIEMIEKVVRDGFCSGCGACAHAGDAGMIINQFGEYQPDLAALRISQGRLEASALSAVCPFLHPELNEDVLAAPLYGDSCEHDSRIGYYAAIYAGYVKESDYRTRGTSGGLGTWIGAELLRLGKIDGVIHVKPVSTRKPGGPFFEYGISRSLDEIQAGAQTRYHAVEISEAMAEVVASPGRYLFIGLPCFCKAVRRLQQRDATIRQRIPFVVSLVCGHLKSMHWTLALAWAAGIPPDQLETFQFRTKGPGISAEAYVFTATPRTAKPVQRNGSLVPGGKWNTCALMLNACDYCDDVVGETADLSIGDAWLPKYVTDPNGTNLIIVRNAELGRVLVAAATEDRLLLEPLTADAAAESQRGGLRHRRDGLSYRLAKARAEGRDVPVKRVKPGAIPVTQRQQEIFDARTAFATASRKAFREALDSNDYSVFVRNMRTHEDRFRKLELSSTLLRRILFTVFSEAILRQVLEVRRTLPYRLLSFFKSEWALLRGRLLHRKK